MVVKKLEAIGEDGKAAAPLIQGRIIYFAKSHNYIIPPTPFFAFEQEIEDCLKGLMVLAPHEPRTANAIIELLRYYAENWSKKGYRSSPDEERRLVYAIEQLGTFGAEAKQAAAPLQDLTLDKSESIGKAAGHALQQVTRD